MTMAATAGIDGRDARGGGGVAVKAIGQPACGVKHNMRL